MADPIAPGVLGTGMAQNAANLERFRPAYMQMAEQAMTNGQEPPPFEAWANQMAAQSQPQPQDRRGMLASLIGALKGK